MQQGQPPYQGPPQPPYHAPPGGRADDDELRGFAPTMIVNAACIGLVCVSLLCFLLMVRLLLVPLRTTGAVLALGHGVLALAALGGAIGIRSGRFGLTILGLLSCPFAGIASLFALLTGSIAGLAGAGGSVVTFVLVVVSLGDVVRMGAARKAIRSGFPSPEPFVPDAPLSGDLPRVRPRRWPVVVALVTIVVVGGGGIFFAMRFSAQAEHEKEVAAFQALETCLLEGKPGAGVAPSLAYRRIEIKQAVVTANPWPARCATHAHALHESKRRSGATSASNAAGEKNPQDIAFFAERLGHVLGDARGPSVYEAVDQLWSAAEKEGYVTVATDAGAASSVSLDVDSLARVAPFSKTRMTLNALHGDRVTAPTLHLLVDGSRQRGEGRLCTLNGSTFRCAGLAPPLDAAALTLLGGVEGDASPLLFANGGASGIFRATGESLGEMPAYGGIARADGSVGVIGYDRRASKFALVRAEKGVPPKRTTFPLKGITEDRQVAALDDNLVWATDAGVLSVARLLPSGAPLGATTELGSVASLDGVLSFDGCRSRDAFFLMVNGSTGSALAVDSGDRWSSLLPVGEGTLDCSGKEAFVLRQQVREGGTGSVSIDRCTAAGCEKQGVDLDEVFQQNVEILPKFAPLAFPLDGKLLLVWRAGLRGGVRMRLAPIEHIAAAEDVVLFDDRIKDGHVSERTNLLELRGWSGLGQAVVFINTTSGTWALRISGDGKVTPIETMR